MAVPEGRVDPGQVARSFRAIVLHRNSPPCALACCAGRFLGLVACGLEAPSVIGIERERRRSIVVASTTIHQRNRPMLMRSHMPTHGVARFAATRGALTNVNAPNANRITSVVTE